MKLNKLAPVVVTGVLAFGLSTGTASAATAAPAPQKAATAAQARATDAVWLKAAAASDLFEIASGTQAAARATTAGTKSIGLLIRAHHTAHLKEVRALAAARRVSLPTRVLPADQAVIDRLQAQSGLQFDRNWLRAQASAHRRTLVLTGQARMVSRDPQVLNLQRRTIPVVRMHQHAALGAYLILAPASEVTESPDMAH